MTSICAACQVSLKRSLRRKGRSGAYLCPACFRKEEATRVCDFCHAEVARADCHKNRYAEYICRACQERGVQPSLRRRTLFEARRIGRVVLKWVGLLVALVLLVKLFMFLLDELTFAPPPSKEMTRQLEGGVPTRPVPTRS
jgi:hypothetical protein